MLQRGPEITVVRLKSALEAQCYSASDQKMLSEKVCRIIFDCMPARAVNKAETLENLQRCVNGHKWTMLAAKSCLDMLEFNHYSLICRR